MQQDGAERVVQAGRVGVAELEQSSACGKPIERASVVKGLTRAATSGEQRKRVGDLQADRENAADVEALRLREQVPAELCTACNYSFSESTGFAVERARLQ
jgi:hypothetical protein